MAELKVEVDPAEVGFDPDRLARIDRHFARYVDDGRLPGWLVVVSRRGRVVHLSATGSATSRPGLPVEADTLWRIYSMTKPITSVAAMMLYEEGAFELNDPVSGFIPSFADMRVYRGGSACGRSRCPATEPMRIWHLLTHTAGLTYGFHHAHPVDAHVPGRRVRVGRAPAADLAGLRRLGRRCRCCSSRARSGTTRSRPTCSAGWSRSPRASRSTSSSHERIFGPLGMTDTGFSVGDERRRPAGRAVHARPRPAGRARLDALAGVALQPPPCSRAAAAWCRPPPTTTASPQMLLPGARRASSTASGCSARAPSAT